MPKRKNVSYEDDLRDSLTDPAFAAAYLNAVLEDEEDDADEVFLLALRDVAAAYKISRLAGHAGVNRENLYRMLSGTGNPKLSSLFALFKALGLRLSVRSITAPDATPAVEAVEVPAKQPKPSRFSPSEYTDWSWRGPASELPAYPKEPVQFQQGSSTRDPNEFAYIA
jgi:probable addiction module antidote protein